MQVPFVDLNAQYQSIKTEIDQVISDVISSSSFVRGPFVENFEEKYAKMMQAEYCISCSDGTAALYIAMKALGLRPGDEVITTAHSWISTSETITQAGGSVVFCDTDPETYTIDPEEIEAKITPRTVGIIPVHLFGQAADMGAVMALARKHGLWVIEDCAQAHLATFNGKQVGTFGNVATWSFYPGKNLGAMGDAGAITTNDPALARTMACFARHGGLVKGSHEIEGINSRLDGLQAAVLGVKLPHLAEWTQRRQDAASVYKEQLAGVDDLVLPFEAPNRLHVWHLFVIQNPKRDALAAFLRDRGIQTVINYPIALPFLEAYKRLDHKPNEFPNSYRNQSTILSLPIFAEITNQQIEYVCSSIREFVK